MKKLSIILIFSVLCAILMYFASEPLDNFSVGVYFSSLAIQIISIINIFSKRDQPYSLYKTFYLFSLFFFGIAPLLQFYKGINLWSSNPLRVSDYLNINILIIIILLLYQLFYYFFYQYNIYKKNNKYILKPGISKKHIRVVTKLEVKNKLDHLQTSHLIILSVLSFILVFYANNYSILSMLFRGGDFKETVGLSSTSHLVIFRIFQPLSMMSLLYYILIKAKNRLVLIFLAISALITCFPFGMARFSAAAMYIPLMLLLVPWLRSKNNFSISFIMGLLIVFPFLENFRYFKPGESIKIGFNFNMFLQGHFDSYQNFAHIVVDNIITWGRQLLGVIFFWAPRSIWPDKPIGSGYYLADVKRLTFSNISCNFFAEGYINFGFIGIFLFIIIISFITARIDKIHWTVSVNSKSNYINVIYYVLIGMLFFMLRGDLMSSFAFTIGFLFSIWLVHKIAGIKIKKISVSSKNSKDLINNEQ
jgi:oligosaccharide repeat unit polymerase